MSKQPTDADPSSKMHTCLHSFLNSLHRRVWALLFVVFGIPTLVHAGVFSFIGLGSEIVYERAQPHLTSQNIQLLQAAIHNDPNPAKGGAEISVLDDSALIAKSGFETATTGTYKPATEHISVYVVREGDTLSQIADMFDVSPNTIRWANDLTGVIQPGQTLVILPVTGVRHTIKSGGTVKDLAELYNADAQEIALFNGISVNAQLNPGDEVLVPNGEIVTKKPKTAGSSSSAKTSGVVAAPRAASGASAGFTNPLPSGIRTQGIHGYNAIDIGAPVGTPIYAAASGQVIISRASGWNGGYGNYIVIKHDNGVQTLYSHMSRVAVGSGAWVSQGEVIGYVGNTGRSTGPHLHFEVRGANNPF